MKRLEIGTAPLAYIDYQSIADGSVQIALSQTARKNIKASRKFLEEKSARSTAPIYGVNTGFGSLCSIEVGAEDLGRLQTNLVRSHACGTGEFVDQAIIRLIIALKLISFAVDVGGIRLEVCESLVQLYNSGALPVIYAQGSLGASGDLAPLAHMNLPLLGEGSLWFKGEIVETQKVLDQFEMQFYKLGGQII